MHSVVCFNFVSTNCIIALYGVKNKALVLSLTTILLVVLRGDYTTKVLHET